MQMMKRRDFLRVSAAGLVAAPFAGPSALAADYPTKPVRWLVGYPGTVRAARYGAAVLPQLLRHAIRYAGDVHAA